MQKLTILILITLVLSSYLYAENDPIILDRDILYWRPAGPDIEIPDVFYHPPLSLELENSELSSLFYPLSPGPHEQQSDAQSRSEPESDDLQGLTLDWKAPVLNTGTGDVTHAHTIGIAFDEPYGSSLLFEAARGGFLYDLEGNYSHNSGYPSWIASRFFLEQEEQSLSASLSIRSNQAVGIASYLKWDGFPQGDTGSYGMQAGVRLSSTNDSKTYDLAAHGGLSHGFSIHSLLFIPSLAAAITGIPEKESWKIVPGFTFEDTLVLKQGDFTFSAGLLSEISPFDSSIKYFPEVSLLYRVHGLFSVFAETSEAELSDALYQQFLTREIYSWSENTYYRWQQSKVGLHFTRREIQGYTAAGFKQGDLPLLVDEKLMPVRMSLLFYEMGFSWEIRGGIITEINSYADHSDKGKFRFMGINSWIFPGEGLVDHYSFLLRSGNRDLLRGYQDILSESSEILAGIGTSIEFVSSLSFNFYLDCPISEFTLEGGTGISFSY
ncbi:hypothetical protein EXM22_06530 [Oceanispirochaeta crateris]|uniref:Uncharacterized protein n=1 Tax=Oceanispirochaeta crateris TaxID=2518645 RepID=A0A5C1QJ67_9SPIO|nr:hypothetical protein [Oceanispirochaeta crateris]QEN07661.1 hypothetical protein EXM22_06530 [Oceanispirochaeta crateris]